MGSALNENINQKVHDRWEHLTSLSTTNSVEGMKYLTLIHLGGMGGTLSFMGATKAANWAIISAFVAFFTGALMVGLTYFFRHHHFTYLIREWNKDCDAMFQGVKGMDWSEVHARDRKRTTVFDIALCTAILSLLAFFVAGIFGFWGVFQFAR